MMRKVLLLILLAAGIVSAQAEQKRKSIYLWDVTLSMKGYEQRTPDIYDKVVDFLVRDISNSPEGTEITVIPFQDKVLGVFTNAEGNEKLIDTVVNYDKRNRLGVTATDIVGPLEYVQSNYPVDKDTDVTVYILTDGVHNKHNGKSADKSDLEKALQSWTDSDWDFQQDEVYYIMLTKHATGITFPANGPKPVTNYFLEPKAELSYNISTESTGAVKLQFKLLENVELPKDIWVKVTCAEYPEVVKNQTLKLEEDLTITIKVDQNAAKEIFTPEELKKSMMLGVDVSNRAELLEKEALVQITPGETRLTVVRKPEKKMTIRYK